MNHFIKFLGIGGLSTLLQFALLALLVEFNLAPEVIASALSYFLSSIFNYLANYYLTFSSNSSHSKTLPKFAVTVGLGLTVSTLLFAVFFKLLGNYLLAQVLATGITLCLNFLAHKLWIYKGH
ncbi:MAG TPA: GtrA family protein [Cellvibrio sp.]|nr:GtrA family protein [Cellvibrio sp.]